MKSEINQESITSIIKEVLSHCGIQAARIETFTEAMDYKVTTYASLKFSFEPHSLLAKSTNEAVIEQTKNFSDNILASKLVVTELRNLTKTIDSQKLELDKLKAEVERLNKFEQHFKVEKSLRHNLELK